MRTGFEQLCLSHLPQLGLKPAQKGQEEKNGVGFTFVPEPEVGDGYLWTYPINATCSLTVYDVVFHRDMSFCYHHPAALTVAVSSPGSGACGNKALHQSRKFGRLLFGRRNLWPYNP